MNEGKNFYSELYSAIKETSHNVDFSKSEDVIEGEKKNGKQS